MGVDAADYDQDGYVDLFVANVDQEMYSIYHNNKGRKLRRRGHAHRHRLNDAPDERMGLEVFRF